MKKAARKGKVPWRLWGWLFLLALAFCGGFFPNYFRAEQLEKKLAGFQENFYQQRVASSVAEKVPLQRLQSIMRGCQSLRIRRWMEILMCSAAMMSCAVRSRIIPLRRRK